MSSRSRSRCSRRPSAFCSSRISLIRYLAIYGVGTLAGYSIVAYKTPWCIISITWPLLFIFGAALLLLPERSRRVGYAVAGGVLALSLILSIRLNYFRATTDTEPYVYVQTYNDIYKLTTPLLELARKDPTKYQLIGHMIRESAYPFPGSSATSPASAITRRTIFRKSSTPISSSCRRTRSRRSNRSCKAATTPCRSRSDRIRTPRNSTSARACFGITSAGACRILSEKERVHDPSERRHSCRRA